MDRSPDEITAGIEQARKAVAEGDDAVIAYLLDVPVEDVRRVCGPRPYVAPFETGAPWRSGAGGAEWNESRGY